MNRKGFTLLELIVVLIVLAALVAIALPQYTGFVERARAAEAIAVLGSIKTAEEASWLASQNYSNDITNLGVNYSNRRWTYALIGNGNDFTATASRTTNDSGTSGQTVVMLYNHILGTTNWTGTHPGAPK